jgi:hypothetical protein
VRSVLGLVFALLLVTPARAQDLEWARTLVFAVGILEFEDPDVETFPQELRRDAELVLLLRERGADVTFLRDREATRARIARDFRALLGRSQPGQTLIVYYTGHGLRTPDGAVGFLPWDGDGELETSWSATEVVESTLEGFKGERALFLIDCCHSGGLADVAVARGDGARVALATLTSSWASSQSTGNWTFTEAVLAALRGEPLLDADADGSVSLAETAAWAEAEMVFGEEQLTTFHAPARFGAATRLAVVTGAKAAPRVGERVEVLDEGEWWKARIIAVRGDEARVHFYGWDDAEDAWVTPERVRPFRPTLRRVGQRVEVEWDGDWFLGRIIEVRPDGLHKVTYDGYDASWDEWVPSSRMRKPRGKDD